MDRDRDRDKRYILAIDQSTSGTKALLVDRSGRIVARSSVEHKQYYPRPGWVEHDPVEIYQQVRIAIRETMTSVGIEAHTIAALTITNQRETAMMWDQTDGLPVYPAIVWQCQRTAERCDDFKAAGHEKMVQAKTGLLIDPYFSAAKWSWILEHKDVAREKLAAGTLLAGTVDSWLIWKLTAGKVHATDYTNASRTSLFNIHTLDWDEELCGVFGVPSSILPQVKSSDHIYGYAEDLELFGDVRIPITGVIGDSQAALYGNRCFHLGMAKATYGTGTSVLMNVGEHPVSSGKGMVSAIAWGVGEKVTYAVEAVIRTSGDSIKWIRDNLGLFENFDQMDQLLTGVTDNEGVYFVPAFVGLGAPYWDPHARAAITGMNRRTGKAHIIRAALESIAYQVRDAVEMMQAESGIGLKELRVDGGASDNPMLMQFQADILERTVLKPSISELSAMGSVYLGGMGIGWWPTPNELPAEGELWRKYEPDMSETERECNYAGWKQSVAAVLTRTDSL